jgi:hypothetical protein
VAFLLEQTSGSSIALRAGRNGLPACARAWPVLQTRNPESAAMAPNHASLKCGSGKNAVGVAGREETSVSVVDRSEAGGINRQPLATTMSGAYP